MCGNTCVWKSPQDSPLLSFALARMMHQAGLPNGVINLVHGKGSGAGPVSSFSPKVEDFTDKL